MANDVIKNNDIFKEVAQKASIVDVIAYFLGRSALIKKGTKYVCVCPFHPDHNPSMQINPERNSFICFVDNHKGDPINFVEQYLKISSLEALKKVCEICNIPLPNSFSRQLTKKELFEKEYKKELAALLDLKKYYQMTLQSNYALKGQRYLKDRGIDKDIIQHFDIGYSSEDPKRSIEALREAGHDVPTLERSGILSSSASLRDRFEERVMFPIEDNYGHVVGFSGRQINKDQPGGKYINYPETALFKKNEILYHFAKAKDAARQAGCIYVVEGFMDVIAFVRAGIENVVATMGTAITENHLRALKGLNVEVRMALDGDEPGRVGIERAMKDLLKNEIPFRVVWSYGKYKDADELISQEGKEIFLNTIQVLLDPVMFLFGRRLNGREKMNDTNEMLQFLKEAAPYYQNLDELAKERDVSQISKRSGFQIDSLLKILENKNAFKEEKKDASIQKPVENESEKRQYPYKKNYTRNRNPVVSIDIRSYSFGDNYRQEDAVQEIQKLTLDYCKRHQRILPLSKIDANSKTPNYHDFMEELILLECNIAVVLTQSRQAFIDFENNHNTLILNPFYVFSSLVGSLYLENPNLDVFTKKEFDRLLALLEENPKEKNEKDRLPPIEDKPVAKVIEEEENLFDLDDLDLDSTLSNIKESDLDLDIDISESEDTLLLPELENEDKELLKIFITILERITANRYDGEKFKTYLSRDKDLVSLYNFYKNIQDEKGGLLSKEDHMKLWNLLLNLTRKSKKS